MELLRLLEDEMGRMTNKTGLLRCEHGIPDGVLNTAAKNCGLAMPLAINVRHFSIEVSAQIVTVWVFDDHTGELLQKKMIWSS